MARHNDSDTTDHATLVRELTAFQRDILFILAEEARYGLAVKRALESERDKEIGHGPVYDNLGTLGDLGLVDKTEIDGRTKEYELTERGMQFCREYLQLRLGQLDHDVEQTHRLAAAEPATQPGGGDA